MSTRNCIICGKIFEAPNGKTACSDQCRKIHRRNTYREWQHKAIQNGTQPARKNLDLTGREFGKLTVIAQAGVHENPGGGRTRLWRCRCECGREENIPRTLLPVTEKAKSRRETRWACSVCSHTRNCIICGAAFHAPNGQVTCSDQCRRLRTNQLAMTYYWQDVETGKQQTRQKQAWRRLKADPERHQQHNAQIREKRLTVPGIAERINQRQRTRWANLTPAQRQAYLEYSREYYRTHAFFARRERARERRLAEFLHIGDILSQRDTPKHTWRPVDTTALPAAWRKAQHFRRSEHYAPYKAQLPKPVQARPSHAALPLEQRRNIWAQYRLALTLQRTPDNE